MPKSNLTLIVDMRIRREHSMAGEIRAHITEAVKSIADSSWRGREHTAEEIAHDIKNFLDEEEEDIITETEWQEIFDLFPIMDLSGKIFQIKDSFVNEYGYGKEKIVAETATTAPETEVDSPEKILLKSSDPIIQEQELVKQLREIRKSGVKRIVELYQEVFPNSVVAPSDKELIDFIKNKMLALKDNRRTVIIALQRIVGLEKIRRVFDILEEKRPFDSKMELFEQWLKKQKTE